MYLRADIELVAMREIAELLGVSNQRVWQLYHDTKAVYGDREPFPEPIAHLRCGRIWLRDEVEDWAREHAHHRRPHKKKGAGRPKNGAGAQ